MSENKDARQVICECNALLGYVSLNRDHSDIVREVLLSMSISDLMDLGAAATDLATVCLDVQRSKQRAESAPK
jgi:hypothetical protein